MALVNGYYEVDGDLNAVLSCSEQIEAKIQSLVITDPNAYILFRKDYPRDGECQMDCTISGTTQSIVWNYAGVRSVNGQTGDVVLTASDVGAADVQHTHSISEVNNLQAAINAKQDYIGDLADIRYGASKGATALQVELDPVFAASPASTITAQEIEKWNNEVIHHTHQKSDVEGLVSDLDSKQPLISDPSDIGAASVMHTHTISDVQNLESALSNKQDNIQDIETIRANAATGVSAKTIVDNVVDVQLPLKLDKPATAGEDGDVLTFVNGQNIWKAPEKGSTGAPDWDDNLSYGKGQIVSYNKMPYIAYVNKTTIGSFLKPTVINVEHKVEQVEMYGDTYYAVPIDVPYTGEMHLVFENLTLDIKYDVVVPNVYWSTSIWEYYDIFHIEEINGQYYIIDVSENSIICPNNNIHIQHWPTTTTCEWLYYENVGAKDYQRLMVEWSSVDNYSFGDIVQYKGDMYKCIKDTATYSRFVIGDGEEAESHFDNYNRASFPFENISRKIYQGEISTYNFSFSFVDIDDVQHDSNGDIEFIREDLESLVYRNVYEDYYITLIGSSIGELYANVRKISDDSYLCAAPNSTMYLKHDIISEWQKITVDEVVRANVVEVLKNVTDETDIWGIRDALELNGYAVQYYPLYNYMPIPGDESYIYIVGDTQKIYLWDPFDGYYDIYSGGTITDVQINGTSIVVDGVANIPIGTPGRLGVVKPKGIDYGMVVDTDGGLFTCAASTSDIDNMTNNYKPVTPYNLKYAVKSALAGNNRINDMNETEQENAREVIGAASKDDVDNKIDKPYGMPIVGDIPKVKSVNIDGSFVCEWADGNVVNDVQINQTSIITDGVASIPVASPIKEGVIRVGGQGKTLLLPDNVLLAQGMTATEFNNASAYAFVSKATLQNVLATPSIMPALTANEQLAARQRIGIDKEWVLKGNLSIDNQTVSVDMTNCSEVYISGSTNIATGTLYIYCKDQNNSDTSWFGIPQTSGMRYLMAIHKDTVDGIIFVTGRNGSTKNKLGSVVNTGYSRLDGVHISDITNFHLYGVTDSMSCDLKIYAR